MIIGALFLGCRSCEYTKTPASAEKKTKPLTVNDFVFFSKSNKKLRHDDPLLASKVYRARVTFRDQKNGEKCEQIVIKISSNTLCGVQAWVRTIQRIRSYPGATNDLPVFTFFDRHRREFKHITSTMVLTTLRDTVTLLGPDKIGVPLRLVGTHSVRISFAMLLILCGAPDSLIKQKGRWKSDAFLRYIRTYVNKYGDDSSAMISNERTGNFMSLGFI